MREKLIEFLVNLRTEARVERQDWTSGRNVAAETLDKVAVCLGDALNLNQNEERYVRSEVAKRFPQYEGPGCDGNHAGPPCGDPECWQL